MRYERLERFTRTYPDAEFYRRVDQVGSLLLEEERLQREGWRIVREQPNPTEATVTITCERVIYTADLPDDKKQSENTATIGERS